MLSDSWPAQLKLSIKDGSILDLHGRGMVGELGIWQNLLSLLTNMEGTECSTVTVKKFLFIAQATKHI